MKNVSRDNLPWIEKYRCHCIKDVVLDKYNRLFFNKVCETENIPQLLFYGPAGTGKTTTILALVRDFQPLRKREVLHLNASDERGIDVIRTQISNFVNSNPFFVDAIKFVILDEVDNMTKSAQYGLSYLMQSLCYQTRLNHEKRPPTVRFCLICNYISKIVPSLKHEFVCIRFNKLPKNDVTSFLLNIARQENLHITKKSVADLYDRYGCDIRAMVNHLQTRECSNLDTRDKIDSLLQIKCCNGICGVKLFVENVFKFAKHVNVNEVLREFFLIYLLDQLSDRDDGNKVEHDKSCSEFAQSENPELVEHMDQSSRIDERRSLREPPNLSLQLDVMETILHLSDDSYLEDILFACFKQICCTCYSTECQSSAIVV